MRWIHGCRRVDLGVLNGTQAQGMQRGRAEFPDESASLVRIVGDAKAMSRH